MGDLFHNVQQTNHSTKVGEKEKAHGSQSKYNIALGFFPRRHPKNERPAASEMAQQVSVVM